MNGHPSRTWGPLAGGPAALVLGALAAVAAEPASLKLVQTIPLKGAPGRVDHMAVDARHGRLFVANLSNNSLDVVDLKEGKLVKQVPGQMKIQGVAYATDLDRIYVGNGTPGECNVFDGRDYRLLKSIKLPEADNVRYDPRTHLVYVEHSPAALAVLDARTYEQKADIKLPGRPEAFQLEPARSRLYLNALGPSQVVVIDTDRNEVLHKYPLKVADRGYPLAVDEANRRLFIGCRDRPVVVVMDSESGKPITTVPIPADIDDLFYDAKHKRLYASCGEGFLAVIRQRDPDHYGTPEKIPTVKLARTCLFDPASGRLYLGLPRREGREGPEVQVYEARP
jgi:DNA-binding beta-propeller fold protein YncE